jgi:acetyl esterase/lipase
MFRKIIIFFIALFVKQSFGIELYIQNDSIPKVSYETMYDVEIEKNLTYGYGLKHESFDFDNPTVKPLKLDVYRPENNFKNRPVLVLIHGGGFTSGSKNNNNYVKLSNFFASRGWVVFTINYRLANDFGSVPIDWINYVDLNSPYPDKKQHKAVYPAIRDAKAALRWIVANKNRFRIDTNYITVGGGSAGGVSSIAVGITNNKDYRDELSIEQDPTLETTNLNTNFKVKTILDFWGSKKAVDAINIIYSKNLYSTNNPSLFIAHGTKDRVVNYREAEELSRIYTTTGASFVLYPLKGKGHGPWQYIQNEKSLEDLSVKFIIEQQGLIVN